MTAQELHSALPCTERDGQGGQNGKPQGTAERESEIRNENLAFKARIHRRGVRHSKGHFNKKP